MEPPSPLQQNRKQGRSMSVTSTVEDGSKPPASAKLQRRGSIKAINTSIYSAALDAVKSGQEADQDTIEDLRVKLKKYMSNSTFGGYYENYILFMSILSMFEFIYQTYLEDEPDKHEHYEVLLLFQFGFAGLFIFDWFLNFFMADHRRKYVTSFFSIVDILTVISIFVTYKREVPQLYIGNTLQEILLYAVFGCLRVRILRALRFQSKFLSIKDAVDRFLAEIALYATVVLLFFTSLIQFLESETLPFPFHTWLYYVWVTVATVGYGDITPHTVTGRFAAMGMIGFALISVPKVTNELIEKMSLQSVYMRAVYTPKSRNSKHIVICGDLSSTSLKDFFGELFHEDHENVDLSAVILLPQAPTIELILLMRDPQFFLSIHYLEGSALVETDLRRAKAESAQAMFIMSNKFSSNSDEEDAKSILLNLSIKRYLAAFNRPNMLYCMQLIRPENRRHLADDEVTGLKDNDLVVCLNEIKMGAMAKAVMYPGANTLLMNLVSSFSDDAIEFGDDDGPEEDGESKVSPRAWLEEYQQGCGWEIYTTSLSKLFKGAKFSELSYALYDRVGVVLFALQIIEKESGVSKLLLNPAEYIIPDQDRYTIEAFVIAENKASSDLSFSEGAEIEVPNESAMDRMRDNIGNFAYLIKSSVTDHTGHDRRKSSAVKDNNFKLNLVQHSTSLEQVKEANESPKREKKQSRWKVLKRSNLLSKKVESYSYQEVLHKLEDEHFVSNYYVQNPPLDLIDCTVKTGVIEEVPYINNHTIVIGKGLRNLYDLIRPLRAKYLGPLRYIVILFPHDIPHEVWQRISVFDAILFVRGSALEESNLRRAGIFRAAQVVVLADGTEESSAAQGMEALVDSDAIFTYQHVKRMNPSTQVVIEIVNQSNIAYLNDEAAPPIDDHKFSPQFAAGSLFTTSLLDSIICQAYYNPQIIKVVNKLISGIDQAERADLAAKASEEIAKKNSPENGDATDSDDEPDKAKNIRMIKSRLNTIKGSCLYQISLPEGLTVKTYGALYQHLATQGIIPLGLLRGTFANMNMGPKANRMPYVFTNPSKETELYSCDRVFVLSITPQRVAGKVEMKDWLLDIQMQQIRQQKEKGNGESSTIVGGRPASHQMKGLENLEKAHKKLDERVSKMSTDMNKKLNSIVAMLERLSANPTVHVSSSGIQQFASITERTSPSPGGEFPAESSRSRFNSIDTMGSNEFNFLPGIQESPMQVSQSIATDTAIVESELAKDRIALPSTTSTKSNGSKGGMSFLKRVIALADTPDSGAPAAQPIAEPMTQTIAAQPIAEPMNQPILEPVAQPAQEIPVAAREIVIPEAKENAIPSASMILEEMSVAAPVSYDDFPSNAELAPLPQSQVFDNGLPQISNVAETYEIDVDDGPSLCDSPLRVDKLGGESSPASAAASVAGIDEEEQLTALKHTIKPQASPRVAPVSKKIVLAKTDVAKNNFMDPSANGSVIPGPTIAVLNSQSTDRAAKIRALRMQNGGSSAIGSPSRPLSASANEYGMYSGPFGQDPSRNRSSTFDHSKGVAGAEKRERASSAHH